VSDSWKKLQDAVFAIMHEATRDLIASIKLDGTFGGGSSKFEVELVDNSVCVFEAKLKAEDILELLTPLRWPVDNGGWGAPKPLQPEDITPGFYWATCRWSRLKEVVQVHADGAGSIMGTEEPYNMDKFKSGYDFICRIPEPS
jgi:hypothetical protein